MSANSSSYCWVVAIIFICLNDQLGALFGLHQPSGRLTFARSLQNELFRIVIRLVALVR